MPFMVTPKVVSRGTIKKSRWKATVTIMCPDRIGFEQTAPMFVGIRWRQGRSGDGPTGQPDETNGVLLTFRKQSEAGGEIKFDGADGQATRGFNADVSRLLDVYGSTRSAADGDVILEVKIDGDNEATIPLSVGDAASSVELRDETGANPAPASLVLNQPTHIKAVGEPPPGQFRWLSLNEQSLEITAGADQEQATLRAIGIPAAERKVGVLFTPDDNTKPAAMIVHPFAVLGVANAAESRVGWSKPEAKVREEVNRVAVLSPEIGNEIVWTITPYEDAGALWIMLLPDPDRAAVNGVLVQSAWQLPNFLPLENITQLQLGAQVNGVEFEAADVAAGPGHEGVALHQSLRVVEGRVAEVQLPAEMTIAQQQQAVDDRFAADAALTAVRATVEADLQAFSVADPLNRPLTAPEFAFTAHAFSLTLTHEADLITVRPRPGGAAARRRWEEDFGRAFVLALLIMRRGAGTNQRQDRADMIAQALGTAGFVENAMFLARMFTNDIDKKFTLLEVWGHRATIPPADFRLILQFFAAETESLDANDLTDDFGFVPGNIDGDARLLPMQTRAFINSLGSNSAARRERVQIIFEVLISAYGYDPSLVIVLAGFLFFFRDLRVPFAAGMWNNGTEYLLFKILSTAEFREPGYGAPTFDGVTLTMATDMTWVYENKQRFFLSYVEHLCQKANTPTNLPAAGFEAKRDWLNGETQKIARALVAVFPGETDKWIWGYESIADIFFFHVDRGNVAPHLDGTIDHLPADEPNDLRIRADCDVFATYGTRFLRGAGFRAVGYMGIFPAVGVGHAGALLELNGDFFVVNNKQVFGLGAIPEARAIEGLRDSVLDTLSNPNPPANFQVFYGAAGAHGEMPQALLDQDPALRRNDLE